MRGRNTGTRAQAYNLNLPANKPSGQRFVSLLFTAICEPGSARPQSAGPVSNHKHILVGVLISSGFLNKVSLWGERGEDVSEAVFLSSELNRAPQGEYPQATQFWDRLSLLLLESLFGPLLVMSLKICL